ncbi:MAG: DUF1552 domain-containing protein [Kangiellaceae bacterium]|jgi:hypothetical protein|nr:DUF1552 domain-containing protein [Kangiellaceae bacterium]
MNRLFSSRRTFLKNMMAAAVMAPLSTSSLAQLAFANNAAKLKVVFAVIPDGFGVDSYGGYNDGIWFPKTSDRESTNFELNWLSNYLGNHASNALFLRGLLLGSGTGGHNAWTTILRDSNASKTSIDLILGNALVGNNPALKRIYSGPHAKVGAQWNISYQDGNKLLPEDNPYLLFDQVFGNVTPSSGGSSDPGTHIFDPVQQDISSLRQLLGSRERAKLDTHLDAVEQVVQDMRSNIPVGDSCTPSAAEPTAGMAITSPDYREQVTKSHANIIAAGLSCGSSRVATMQIGRSADQVVIKSVSTTRNPHDCAHRYGNVDEWRYSRAWYVEQVKYLLDRLAAFPDPDVAGDSLLDHTLVVFTSEMADGAPEHMQDLPITLLGGASGLLQNGNGNGRFLNVSNQGDRTHWRLGQCTDVQRVWSTIAQAAGTSVPYSGNTSKLSGLFTNV